MKLTIYLNKEKNILGVKKIFYILIFSLISYQNIYSAENENENFNSNNSLSELDTTKSDTTYNVNKSNKNLYQPFIKNFDLLLDYGGPLWDFGKRLFSKDKILSIKGGIGLNTKFGLYTLIMLGYTNISSIGIPQYDILPKYRTYGPHFRIGPGYAMEYLRGGYVTFLIRYGVSLYKSEVNKLKLNKLLSSHYIDILVDNKARIISSLNLFLGGQLGVQFLIYHDDIHENLNNYLIPGYGWCKNKVSICGGLYIAYSFQFNKPYKSVK